MKTLSIRLPDSLHKRIKQMAAAEGISINQFITRGCSREGVGSGNG